MTHLQCSADGGRLAERESPSAMIEVVDEWGQRRVLTKCAEGDSYEGCHDTGAGPEPYWLQASVVEKWIDAQRRAEQKAAAA